MNRMRVLLHAVATLLPVLLFAVSMIVFATQLFSGRLSYVALILMLVSIVWIASGVWRRAALPKRAGETS